MNSINKSINSTDNENNAYNPFRPLIDSYLSIDENNLISGETIPGFIDASSVESKTEGLPIRSMYDNRGKYFDQYLFNKKFDEYIEEQQKLNLKKQNVRLDDLNKIENLKIKPYQLPFDKILINIKNMCFEMFDNTMAGENPINSINGDNLFYLGILCLTITLLYITIAFIFE
jgi:hypothetical protein